MKRLLVLLSVVLSGVATSFAAPEAGKARYLVATRKPARQIQMPFERDIEIRRFESVRGFAAELTEAEVAELKKSSDVLFIEPDVPRYAIGAFPSETTATRETGESSTVSASVESTQQTPYGVTMVGAPRVWSLGRGRTIRVGVLDTGIEINHPEIADDYKGGYDFFNEDEIPEDDNGHGTHVAGTIAAADNGFGVIGVAPDVEIYSLKVLGGPSGSGSVSDIIRAIDWAIEHRLHVINMSLGSDRTSLLEEQALQRAADAGIISVAAAGNSYSGLEGLSYPAHYSTVISVGAIDEQGAIASFSQRGPTLKVVAPGIRVLSLGTVIVELRAGANLYSAGLLEGSPRGTVTGQFVGCGLGRIGDFPEAVRGKIALIQRGEITFREKATNAKNAGATAVIIYNNVASFDSEWTLISGSEEENAFPFPLTVRISKHDGEALLPLAGQIEIAVEMHSGGFATMNGTSMASPHVAGVAAVVWSIAPNASAAQVRQAIFDSAFDLGAAGFDTTFGFGLANAYEAARRLAPEKFPAAQRRRATRR